MPEDIAIAHDQLTERGGAETVAFEFARALDAPIYAATVDQDIVPEDITVVEVFDSRGAQALLNSHYLLADAYQMLAWQHVPELYEHDAVLLNKNNPGWFVPKDTQTVLKYCHSPPRGAYDLFHKRGEGFGTRVLNTPMRLFYRQNVSYVDAWACNSELVQRRIESYWDRDTDRVDVIHPPVDVDSYGADLAADRDYYFTFSRLEGHKRIDEIVRAFDQLGEEYQLVVGGDGSERDRLESMAPENVEFVGYMDEAEKRRRLAEAKAFVFAAENEDFGLVPIESMASGTPVIGVKDGFTQHQVLNGENGLTWARQGGHLREAIRQFERHGVEWDAERIQAFAAQFGVERFHREIREWVADAVEATRVEAPWEREESDHEHARASVARTDGGDQ